MPRARRTPAAKADVAEIWKHIAVLNFDAAERWLAEIDDKVALLSRFPGLGRRRDELAKNLRSYPVGNYLIFYLKVKGGIEIIRVLHGARNLRKLFRRK
jgi:toxin ParE1/3/4